jgi:hypothetical protein
MKGEILPPLSARVHVKQRGWRFSGWLWLPLFLFWVLFLLLVILALPLLLIASLIFRFSLWRSLRAGNAMVVGLHGTRVDIDDRDSNASSRFHGKDTP